MEVLKLKKNKSEPGGYFIRVDRGEAIKLIKTLSAQIDRNSPNLERDEFYTDKGEYFTIAVHKNLHKFPEMQITPYQTGDKKLDKVLRQPPEKRGKNTGDPLYDKILGILVGFSIVYDSRDKHIDIITVNQAELEIKKLIQEEKNK